MKGKVYLVGAGPGDYKLLTLKGFEVLKKADVLVYDYLVNTELLKFVRRNCELIYVGKKANNHTMKQEDINKLLLTKAKNHKTVVRLKGGDPYVFGRGGEEAEYLYDNEIEFEVIPGITSAIGGLSYAGIPITNRGYSSSFHVMTGHLKDNSDLNLKELSNLNGTLVFLMGMSNLDKIVNNLIENGVSETTPVAIINWATRPYQKTVVGNLKDIVSKVNEKNIKNPSLIVIGEVVKLREKLNFFERKPLFGKNVIVTRARNQNSKLIDSIYEYGGNPIEFPTISIITINNDKLNKSITSLQKYNYIIFTSKNSVEIFFDNLLSLGYDSRKLSGIKIVSIGIETANSLLKYGIKADIIPSKFSSEYVYYELKDMLNSTDNILIPRSRNSRRFLVDALSKICNVDEVFIYETVINNHFNLDNLLNLNIDYITFTSSSTVKNFVEIVGLKNLEIFNKSKIISIGPKTSDTIKSFSLNVYKEAKEYTIDGIMNCLLSEKE